MRFTDIENTVRLFLLDRLEVPVHTRVPNPRPADFVRVWRTGGAAVNRVLDVPHITVESWGSNDARASDVANHARQALLSESSAMTLVRGVEEVSGAYYDPDPVSGATRYSFTVRMYVRAAR